MGVLRNLYRNWLVGRHSPAHWKLRPETIDRRIFRRVVIDNEYELPECFTLDDTVLDIGGHIGSFALAALRRGAGLVCCCEPDAGNFALLRHNLAPYHDRTRLLQLAVWRCDRATDRLGLHNPIDRRNTGAAQVTLAPAVQTVAVVAFDELVADLTADGRRLRLVKLDCEGAEWPILLTSRRLESIDALCGEYHLVPPSGVFDVPGQPGFSPDLLVRRLSEQGFRTRVVPLGDDPFVTGLFFASR